MFRQVLTASAAMIAAGFMMAAPAQALTMKECGAKYQAAKEANTLKGQKWNEFRKAECGDDDASDADAAAAVKEDAAAPAAPAAAPKPAAKTATAPAAPAAPAAPTAGSGKVVFPNAVAEKYASETAGKARMHTCVDQYNANKASGGNGELKWIMKGGGYYSQCNTKLKS